MHDSAPIALSVSVEGGMSRWPYKPLADYILGSVLLLPEENLSNENYPVTCYGLCGCKSLLFAGKDEPFVRVNCLFFDKRVSNLFETPELCWCEDGKATSFHDKHRKEGNDCLVFVSIPKLFPWSWMERLADKNYHLNPVDALVEGSEKYAGGFHLAALKYIPTKKGLRGTFLKKDLSRTLPLFLVKVKKFPAGLVEMKETLVTGVICEHFLPNWKKTALVLGGEEYLQWLQSPGIDKELSPCSKTRRFWKPPNKTLCYDREDIREEIGTLAAMLITIAFGLGMYGALACSCILPFI